MTKTSNKAVVVVEYLTRNLLLVKRNRKLRIDFAWMLQGFTFRRMKSFRKVLFTFKANFLGNDNDDRKFFSQEHNRGNVMVWGAPAACGSFSFAFIEGVMSRHQITFIY